MSVHEESYRVVGNTLIVNKPGYLANARYSMQPSRLTIDDARFTAVLDRI